jgi:hypothetical protein
MKTTNKTIILSLIIMFCVLSQSCEKEIKLNFGEEDKMLVVNSVICPDSLVKVRVSYSQQILANEPVFFVNNAQIRLFEDGTCIDTLAWLGQGKYVSRHKPQTNKVYGIEVSDGKRKATANCRIPDVASIAWLKSDTTYDQMGFAYPGVTIAISDKPGQKDFYRLFLKRKAGKIEPGDYFGNTVFAYNDEAINAQTGPLDAIGNYIEYGTYRNYNKIELVFSDKSFNGTIREIKLSEIRMVINKTLFIHLHTLSEEYYKYLYSIKNKPDEFFSEPVGIYSNIENGLGIFAAYNEVVDSIFHDLYPN